MVQQFEHTKFTSTGLPKVDREELHQLFAISIINRKSLLILGKPGTGKTYRIRHPRMVSASQLATEYQINGIGAVKALINNQIDYQNRTVVIDDLGTEENVKNFGNQLDPIAYVIQGIYDINQRGEEPILLYLTSNLNIKELTERYGERVIDRIHEMCDIVVLEDTNLRR